MQGFVTMRVTCFITPKDLREIADEMEKKWANLECGDSTNVREWFIDDFTTINFSIDQRRMKDQVGEFGQGTS